MPALSLIIQLLGIIVLLCIRITKNFSVNNKLCRYMNNKARIRRTAKLCLGCIRGIAYYRAGEHCKDKWIEDDFWVHNNSNSIDMAVMDWCKIFGDSKAEHYWKKSVSDPEKFYLQLLSASQITETDYDNYIKEMREYRDKFLAHLDKEDRMHIPHLDIALATSVFLYSHWAQGNSNFQNVIPNDGQIFYESRLKHAQKKYANAK